MQGVFLDRESLDRDDLDLTRLRASGPEWTFHDATSREETAARIAGAEVVITNKVPLDRPLLAAAHRLRLVMVAATGTNNVDLDAAARLGITVCNVRGYATPSVVQHTFALLLALATRLGDYSRAAVDGTWAGSRQFCLLDYPVRELSGLTLGVVGYGELGRAVAETARNGFGMEVLVAERRGRPPRPGRTPFERVLAEADVITTTPRSPGRPMACSAATNWPQ